MGKQKPLISVITPSYNQGEFIEKTILSVKNQDYENIEHIILDSCSDDQTDAIISRYLNTYNLTYIRKKDSGQANAINSGFNMAKGKIVCWLNSDDIFFNNFVISRVVEIFNQNPEADVVSGNSHYIDENDRLLRPIMLPTDSNMYSMKFFSVTDIVTQPSTFWRNNNIRLDENLYYVFDWKFFIDMYRSKFSFLYMPEYFSKYRVQQKSKTLQNSAKRKLEVHQIAVYANATLIQKSWTLFVYCLYFISEQTKIDTIKEGAMLLNNIVCKLSSYYLHSC